MPPNMQIIAMLCVIVFQTGVIIYFFIELVKAHKKLKGRDTLMSSDKQ